MSGKLKLLRSSHCLVIASFARSESVLVPVWCNCTHERTSLLTSPSRSIVNEGAAASPKQPIVNMGQGFFGYNPPQFILNAAKEALDKVDCNQYSPTKGRPRLRKAIADSYSPLWGRKLDPETEVTITTGANEGDIWRA